MYDSQDRDSRNIEGRFMSLQLVQSFHFVLMVHSGNGFSLHAPTERYLKRFELLSSGSQ